MPPRSSSSPRVPPEPPPAPSASTRASAEVDGCPGNGVRRDSCPGGFDCPEAAIAYNVERHAYDTIVVRHLDKVSRRIRNVILVRKAKSAKIALHIGLSPLKLCSSMEPPALAMSRSAPTPLTCQLDRSQGPSSRGLPARPQPSYRSHCPTS
ncbi:unnamed protein product, partial [Iphiclides podalirius]